AEEKSAAERCRHRHGDEWQHLPLRHLSTHPRRHSPGGKGALKIKGCAPAARACNGHARVRHSRTARPPITCNEVAMKLLLCAIPLVLAASAALADPPADHLGRHHHPTLAAAQRLSTQAFEKIVAAQKANEFDLGGHAQKAK